MAGSASPGPDAHFERQRLDYEQTLETYRQLVDIRFKLLAFIPTLTGGAVALLSAADIEPVEQFALSLLGLFVTVGLVVYDQRNTQLHDGAIGRLEYLERDLDLPAYGGDRNPGLFGSRLGPRREMLGVEVRHDPPLWLIYSAAVGAWVFAAITAVTDITRFALLAAVAGGGFMLYALATAGVPRNP
jgi:hypothetical protein